MQRRCPGSRSLGAAMLEGYQFRFDGASQNWGHHAAANIIPHEGSVVWGALYEMSDQNQADLDRFEPNYQRTELVVHNAKTGYVRAISYVRPALTVGLPSPEYIAAIQKGAQDNALPAEYIQEVVALADRS